MIKQLLKPSIPFLLSLFTTAIYANSSSLYDEMARQSGGMVFHLDKNELSKDQGAFFGKTIEAQIDSHLLWSAYGISLQPGATFDLPLDQSISYAWIIISAATSKPQLQLIAPNQISTSPEIISNGSALIYSMPTPQPGIWKVVVFGVNKFDIQVKIKSEIYVLSHEVQRMALGHEGLDYFKYDGPLIPGNTEMFEVTVIDPTKTLNKLNLSVVNLSGNILDSSNTKTVRMNEWLSVRAKLKIPKDSFRLMVSGVDKQGNIFVRMGEPIM